MGRNFTVIRAGAPAPIADAFSREATAFRPERTAVIASIADAFGREFSVYRPVLPVPVPVPVEDAFSREFVAIGAPVDAGISDAASLEFAVFRQGLAVPIADAGGREFSVYLDTVQVGGSIVAWGPCDDHWGDAHTYLAVRNPSWWGACCAPTGVCTVKPAAACATPSIWQGPGSNCLVNPCPQPPGACCAPDGACTVIEQLACTDPSFWQGPSIPCTPNPCTVSDVDDVPLATTLAFRVAPTPFAQRTALVFAGPKGTEASLQIFDVAGRRVRSAWRGVLDGREITREWDGRDDAGRETPTGVYLARLRSEAGEVVVRLVRAR
jgi:hypothetical protein